MFLRVSVCPAGGWYPSMHCRWYPNMPCSRSLGGRYPSMPCRFPGPHPRGKLRGSGWGGSPGPHPRGKLRGIWLGGSSGPHPRGACSRRYLLWGARECLLQGRGYLLQGRCGDPRDGYCCERLRILLECILVPHLFITEIPQTFDNLTLEKREMRDILSHFRTQKQKRKENTRVTLFTYLHIRA